MSVDYNKYIITYKYLCKLCKVCNISLYFGTSRFNANCTQLLPFDDIMPDCLFKMHQIHFTL